MQFVSASLSQHLNSDSLTLNSMISRRRRSSIELEVEMNVPAASPSVNVLQAREFDSDAGLADMEGVGQQLEAADGGAAARTILSAAFMFEAVLFGKDSTSFYLTGLLDAMFTYYVDYMRSRLPPSHASAVTRTDWSFASKPLFLVYCFANLAQGLGFFFPSLFLPSYAASLGLSTRQGAMLLSMMSAAQVVGQ